MNAARPSATGPVLRASSGGRLAGATLAMLLAVSGCTGIELPHRAHLDSNDDAARDCARWYAAIDRAVDEAAVGDRAARRIDGFPYLRIDRFTAAFSDAAADDAALRDAWIERMRVLGDDGHRIEIGNLPAAAMARLDRGDRDALAARARDCAARLARLDLADTAASAELERRARVEDDYSTASRTFGVYLLTRIPFYFGVKNWQDEVSQTFAMTRAGAEPSAPLLRYRPPALPGYTRAEVGALIARGADHPLGLPRLSADERERLFATYAPVFEIETGGDFDRIGEIYWSGDSLARVDVARPTVYRRLDYTRYGERTLLQLVYTAWLPERPRKHGLDLLGGHLDGLAWRVTLAPDGAPVLYDSIHPCGCYHVFFPTPRVAPIESPRYFEEWAFMPATLPLLGDGERLVVSLQTGTHYLRNVSAETETAGRRYAFADYDRLRALPLPRGGSRSLFDPDGIVTGSERGERFLFWPMGIHSAGAMRQAGSHATAFVGRRHFDDADIVEKRFRLLD